MRWVAWVRTAVEVDVCSTVKIRRDLPQLEGLQMSHQVA